MSRPASGWKHFPHGADIGLCGYGPSPDDAFEQAALALTGVITEPSRVRPKQSVHIGCSSPDPELLFADWLNALIFEMATRQMLFGSFDVHIAGDHLEATARGEPVSRNRHEPAVEIKGATYTELGVRQDENGIWTATCVVDV